MEGRRYELRPGRTWVRVGAFVALATVLPGPATIVSTGAAAQSIRTSALTPGTEPLPEADLPSVLVDGDLRHYQRIFRLQAAAQWASADREIAALDDRLLIGTVEAQRYLHPAYRPNYTELSHWLARHAEEPDARAIYALALKHRPANATTMPARPAVAFLVPRGLREEQFETAAFIDWEAGLGAWRRGRVADARRRFAALAARHDLSSAMTAAAAFWTARAELRSDHPTAFTHWLGVAAEHPRTFYGLLARRILGTDGDLALEGDPFTVVDAGLLLDAPTGRRALALLQIGDGFRAEAELRSLAPHASPLVIEALVAVADRANMPALSLQLAGLLSDGAGRRHHALYPLPRWTPVGGFTVDRALLFAVMRQESQFATRVESPAGAVGVMQLMPATAHAMALRAGVRLDVGNRRQLREALADPEINMALAQEYITELMENAGIGDNLLLLAAAYNCGPTGPQRWQSDPELRNDPLLFLESIPHRETRIFTERVLANYWIYRQRLGQPTPDLDALAAGEWPTYTALDLAPEPERRHAQNR
jgi:soluble lytic murein transglycosylase